MYKPCFTSENHLSDPKREGLQRAVDLLYTPCLMHQCDMASLSDFVILEHTANRSYACMTMVLCGAFDFILYFDINVVSQRCEQ